MASSSGFPARNNEELRIVMVGKTGNGKSATGNTILRCERFNSRCSPKSITVSCSKYSEMVDGQQVAVIDTPGLFDTSCGEEKTARDLSQCIAFAAPGPHVFLVVVAIGRFTNEEKQAVKRIQDMFGDAADEYSMVLFTGGDNLDTTCEQFVDECPSLQELVRRCNGQYHVFNNRINDKKQVTKLLQKIRDIVQKNGGSHYTNEMFQEAERKIEEEKRRILKEKEEKIRREKEEMERKIEEKYHKDLQKLTEKYEAEREVERREMERERKKREREWEKMNEEKKKEREERKREREENERSREAAMNELKELKEKQLRMENMQLQVFHETTARKEAERKGLFSFFTSTVQKIADAGAATVNFIPNTLDTFIKMF